jgi:hypothetical protein
MDFLCKAVNNKLISEADGDDFIKKVIASGSRLPVKTEKSLLAEKLSFELC